MDFTSANGQHFGEKQYKPLKRKMTHEAHEPELQTKKKLRRPETEEKVVKTAKREQVDGPLEMTVLQPEETAKKGGSENNKTEKRDIYDHYILGELLGHGSFGCVYAGVRISDGKKVALGSQKIRI